MKEKELKILSGIRKGNIPDYRYLYDAYYSRLLRYAISYVENKEIAEDMVQDVFLKLWEKREDAGNISSISSYLFRAVHNTCIQYLRHQTVSEKYKNRQILKFKEVNMLYHSWNQSELHPTDYSEINQIVERTLCTLPFKTREIFNLSRKKMFSNRDISEKMSIDIKTVEYHITKALRLFRISLKDYLIFLAWLLFSIK